ncbi:MAG: hypothetical protein RBS80_03595 [Thermoguttaceae bacterium]|jgi:ABC-type nitrate/sulfonate/bicarbonate transport system permease component|nr:hypothetical protein [Thermoguttaceae bacterium]
MSRNLLCSVTACFGAAVILSGLYRYVMEPGGDKGLWFGVVMGLWALFAAWLQRAKQPLAGHLLAAVVAVFVGGWFAFENFGEAKHEVRMYVMIALSIIQLAVLAIAWVRRGRPVA